jgi:hypothetical protein
LHLFLPLLPAAALAYFQVAAIQKMVQEACLLEEAALPDTEACKVEESPVPASSTCPSAPSTIPSSSPALSWASSADAAQLEEFLSGFFEDEDNYRMSQKF